MKYNSFVVKRPWSAFWHYLGVCFLQYHVMFKIVWDKETGGVLLTTKVTKETLGISPRPVFWEELDLIGLNTLGWKYPHSNAPLLWAINKQYWYRGEMVFEVKGANIYDSPTVIFAPQKEKLTLKPINMKKMLERNSDLMFLLESEAIEFIRDIFTTYSAATKSVDKIQANQLDFEALKQQMEKKTRKKMAIVKEDCDSFDIMPLEVAKESGKRIYQGTRVDYFLASFSGGKDSQVVLDLVTRAIPPTSFEVIYSDTGYELPSSLELYENVKKYYVDKFPELKFSIARNHENVINYWDKIGTPSDSHRWCCTVMKTAPLYRMFKVPGTNKQAKVLTFEGVRAEESTRRSEYQRIGKGVKHSIAINARPILRWNQIEIFLYIFQHSLPINKAYRSGITRVGCVICPFSSEWNEFVASKKYNKELCPFLTRLEDNAQRIGVKDYKDYIKSGNWKRRYSGNSVKIDTLIKFRQTSDEFNAQIENPNEDILEWLFAIGSYTLHNSKSHTKGDMNYKGNIYPFEIETKDKNLSLTFYNCKDVVFIGLLKRVLYKTAYCHHCEVCEVECPTGALSVLPNAKINQNLCIHCNKCLTFHDKGCIVANSLSQTINTNMNAQTGIDRYKNFGLKEEWVDSFFTNPLEFWDSEHGLNKQYQVPALKNWLKDAEIVDDKYEITSLGRVLHQIYQDNPSIVWEIIWINLTYNSFIAKWFSSRVNANTPFTGKMLEQMIQSEFPVYKDKTVHNAVYQLTRTLKESPIGSELEQYNIIDKENALRQPYTGLSLEATAYSIYKYAENKGISFLRVSDLYRTNEENGVGREFCIDRPTLLKKLRSLSSEANRVLVAELNMGLDHITLRDELDATKALSLVYR